MSDQEAKRNLGLDALGKLALAGQKAGEPVAASPKTPGFIEVGREVDGTDCFIGVPDGFYEACIKPVSGRTLHVVRFDRRQLPWLINALMGQAGWTFAEYDPEMDS